MNSIYTLYHHYIQSLLLLGIRHNAQYWLLSQTNSLCNSISFLPGYWIAFVTEEMVFHCELSINYNNRSTQLTLYQSFVVSFTISAGSLEQVVVWLSSTGKNLYSFTPNIYCINYKKKLYKHPPFKVSSHYWSSVTSSQTLSFPVILYIYSSGRMSPWFNLDQVGSNLPAFGAVLFDSGYNPECRQI